MSAEPTNVEKIRRLPWLVATDALNTIFCTLTIFGSVFILFLSELGMDKTRIGVVLSLLPFCGLIALFLAPVVAYIGFKRTFLIFFGARKLIVAFLLLGPWILSSFGPDMAFMWVTGIVLLFAICRAVGETAVYPWLQEAIPNHIRGKFGAVNSIICRVAQMAALAVATYVIGHFAGLCRYMALILSGVVAGLFSVWCMSFVPGGAPIRDSGEGSTHFGEMLRSLRDKNYLFFIGGLAFVTFGISSFSFVPLFMKEQVGLTLGNVVSLEIGTSLGALLSSYPWGWTSDRYGSKPVMLSGLYLMILLPVCWFLIPRHSNWSSHLAMGIAFLGGIAIMGWITGSTRYLFVSAVPIEKKTTYMAVFYAWSGLVGGCATLLSGWFLDFCSGISGKFSIFTVGPYTPLFAAGFALLAMGIMLISRVRADGAMPVGKFVSMFLQGNPFMAVGALVRYRLAKDETDRVSTTERMGESKNPLSIDELVEALSDPSFNVRYESIISISRMLPDPKLIDALVSVLAGNEPDLSVGAAWALGRIGDKRAITPLRETLLSEYPLLRARGARALATLGDVASIPSLLERFRTEPNDALRVAYASALGILRSTEATGELLTFLRTTQNEVSRGELALALARIVGEERYYIRLWRGLRLDMGTTVAQAVLALEKNVANLHLRSGELRELVGNCAKIFAKNDLIHGAALLSAIIRKLLGGKLDETSAKILRECAERLTEFGDTRIEYILLSLHAINGAYLKQGPNAE